MVIIKEVVVVIDKWKKRNLQNTILQKLTPEIRKG